MPRTDEPAIRLMQKAPLRGARGGHVMNRDREGAKSAFAFVRCSNRSERGGETRETFRTRREVRSESFLEGCGRFRWQILAFSIMRNHFHLAVETPEPNLSEGMKWLQGTWAVRFNRFQGENGRPFQGRDKAWHVEPGAVLAQVV